MFTLLAAVLHLWSLMSAEKVLLEWPSLQNVYLACSSTSSHAIKPKVEAHKKTLTTKSLFQAVWSLIHFWERWSWHGSSGPQRTKESHNTAPSKRDVLRMSCNIFEQNEVCVPQSYGVWACAYMWPCTFAEVSENTDPLSIVCEFGYVGRSTL